jgi:hypothetical protein
MEIVMKRAIFAAVFWLAAAGMAAAANASLAGLIQAGNRDAALKMRTRPRETVQRRCTGLSTRSTRILPAR